ncbi:MAG: TetR/AcrR family transcriptional regulator [Flavobacteriaceae bacterium]|nr:TetR/AcrR family transcriptional regulator [Flavobacteriaceae bacterium]
MRNAEFTKNTILRESANLFNTKGYKATSISDITRATGLTKGAIYRHFESKSDLEQQALQRLSKTMFSELGSSIQEASNFQLKMEAIFEFFSNYMETPLYEGGCPLMNASIETDDDTNTLLRDQASRMLTKLRSSVAKLLENGVKNDQVHADIDISTYTTVFIATLEGGIMMSKLERDDRSIHQIIDHLRMVVRSISI